MRKILTTTRQRSSTNFSKAQTHNMNMMHVSVTGDRIKEREAVVMARESLELGKFPGLNLKN